MGAEPFGAMSFGNLTFDVSMLDGIEGSFACTSHWLSKLARKSCGPIYLAEALFFHGSGKWPGTEAEPFFTQLALPSAHRTPKP